MNVYRGTLLLLGLWLAGCSASGPSADLTEYLTRLERVLDQRSQRVAENSFPRLPAVRALRLEPAQENIELLDFLRLRRCELQQVVAERNSSLGRLARPSQRLVHEIDFLRLGDACLEAIRDDYPELAADLQRVLASKRADLPVAIWQATVGGEEFRDFWQARSGPLPLAFEEDSALLQSLEQLSGDIQRWRAGDYTVDSTRLEHQLDVIRRGSGGQQLLAWSKIHNSLNAASNVVRDRIERRPLCFKGMQTPKANILNTVIREWFIGRVQRWAAGLNARYYEEWPVVRALEGQLADVQPSAYVQWREQRDTFIEQARGALAGHVEALRPLLEACQLLPDTESTSGGSAARPLSRGSVVVQAGRQHNAQPAGCAAQHRRERRRGIGTDREA